MDFGETNTLNGIYFKILQLCANCVKTYAIGRIVNSEHRPSSGKLSKKTQELLFFICQFVVFVSRFVVYVCVGTRPTPHHTCPWHSATLWFKKLCGYGIGCVCSVYVHTKDDINHVQSANNMSRLVTMTNGQRFN